METEEEEEQQIETTESTGDLAPVMEEIEGETISSSSNNGEDQQPNIVVIVTPRSILKNVGGRASVLSALLELQSGSVTTREASLLALHEEISKWWAWLNENADSIGEKLILFHHLATMALKETVVTTTATEGSRQLVGSSIEFIELADALTWIAKINSGSDDMESWANYLHFLFSQVQLAENGYSPETLTAPDLRTELISRLCNNRDQIAENDYEDADFRMAYQKGRELELLATAQTAEEAEKQDGVDLNARRRLSSSAAASLASSVKLPPTIPASIIAEKEKEAREEEESEPIQKQQQHNISTSPSTRKGPKNRVCLVPTEPTKKCVSLRQVKKPTGQLKKGLVSRNSINVAPAVRVGSPAMNKYLPSDGIIWRRNPSSSSTTTTKTQRPASTNVTIRDELASPFRKHLVKSNSTVRATTSQGRFMKDGKIESSWLLERDKSSMLPPRPHTSAGILNMNRSLDTSSMLSPASGNIVIPHVSMEEPSTSYDGEDEDASVEENTALDLGGDGDLKNSLEGGDVDYDHLFDDHSDNIDESESESKHSSSRRDHGYTLSEEEQEQEQDTMDQQLPLLRPGSISRVDVDFSEFVQKARQLLNEPLLSPASVRQQQRSPSSAGMSPWSTLSPRKYRMPTAKILRRQPVDKGKEPPPLGLMARRLPIPSSHEHTQLMLEKMERESVLAAAESVSSMVRDRQHGEVSSPTEDGNCNKNIWVRNGCLNWRSNINDALLHVFNSPKYLQPVVSYQKRSYSPMPSIIITN